MDMEIRKGVSGDGRKESKDQHDFKSKSFSYRSKSFPNDPGLKKETAKSVSSRFALWNCLNDPEIQRKKRVANYKAYTMEGKMKGSFRKSFKWVKERCNQVINGY